METFSKYCIISAVGHDSLHRKWKDKRNLYDLHLIVYDDSLEKFRDDADYICQDKGYKLRLIYRYLQSNPWLLVKYDYFFFPDDDIDMDGSVIIALFEAMKKYQLDIAQPSLSRMSYFTWKHTLRNCCCRLRYTNFVEMMVPCFSRNALKKVLFTFDENETGWGTETLWPLLIGNNGKNMAIIDEVSVLHTRPIQSGSPRHQDDLATYLKKHNLRTEVLEYGYLANSTADFCERRMFEHYVNLLQRWTLSQKNLPAKIGLDGYVGHCYLLFLLTCLTNSRSFSDMAQGQFEAIGKYFSLLENDMRFDSGITGCCWLVLFLAENGIVKEDPMEIIDEFGRHVEGYMKNNAEMLDVQELAGIGRLYLKKTLLYPTLENSIAYKEVILRLQEKLTPGVKLGVLIDGLALLQHGEADIRSMTKETEKLLRAKKETSVEQLHHVLRLYQVTGDDFFKISARERLKNMRPSLLTLADSIKLAEVLFFITREK